MQEIQSIYALNLAITNSGLQLWSMSREDQTYVPQVDGICAFRVAAVPESPTQRHGCYQHYTQHASSRYLIASLYSVSLLIWSCRPRVEHTSVWHILSAVAVVFSLGVSSTSYTHVGTSTLGYCYISLAHVSSARSRLRHLEHSSSQGRKTRLRVFTLLGNCLSYSVATVVETPQREKVFTIECFYMCICIHLNKCPCAW